MSRRVDVATNDRRHLDFDLYAVGGNQHLCCSAFAVQRHGLGAAARYILGYSGSNPPYGGIDIGERSRAIFDRQIGQIDIDRQTWKVSNEKIDGRATLQCKDVLLCNERKISNKEADLRAIGFRRRHRVSPAQ